MNIDRLKQTMRNKELLGLEPLTLLRTLVEQSPITIQKQQLFEEVTSPFFDIKQIEQNNPAVSSLDELFLSAKFDPYGK
jgi:hypothetical protein